LRLDKFICKSTHLTKAEAIARIQDGDVIVNGDTVVVERTQVHEDNHIIFDGQRLQARPFRYILVHKSVDTICSNIDEAYPSLFSGLGIANTSELHVAGRLDADTTGLVLVTDDGRWSFDIIRPSLACEKVYRVNLSKNINTDAIARLKLGVQLQGELNLTLPAKLEVVGPRQVLLTIIEGKYHLVKRMFAAVGNRVIGLHRERVGAVTLDIEEGHWRYLTADEMNSFMIKVDSTDE
jgi:16S rRNA pseudouridine516 synthase